MTDTGADTDIGGSLGAQAMQAVDSGAVEEAETTEVEALVEESEAPEPEGAEATQEVVDLESYFAEEEPKSEEDDLDDDEDEEAEEEDKTQDKPVRGGRAQRRIRSLASRVKEQAVALEQAQQQASQYNQWARQQQQQQQQMAQAYQQQQLELARLQSRFEGYTAAKPEEKDAVDEFSERLLSQAQEKVSPEIAKLRDELKGMQDQQAQAQRIANQRQQRQRVNYEADQAVAKHIIPYTDEETVEGDKNMLGSLVVALAAMTDTDLESAAQTLRRLNMNMSRGVIRARSKQNGAKLRASKAVPQPAPASGKTAQQEVQFPPLSKLKRAGYPDYVKWQMAGSPPIK